MESRAVSPHSAAMRTESAAPAGGRGSWWHRRAWFGLACVLLFAACSVPGERAAAEGRRPNVVMILSDDQGWGDFGFMGHEVIRTPHLDRLADESLVFPRGYVPSSLCRPSLATAITGLYPHQHKLTGNDPPAGVARERMLRHIAAVRTLPRELAGLGYRSLQSGKWWEGNCMCGGFTDGMTHGDPDRGGRHGDEGLRIGRQTMAPITEFLDACGDEPFFLWYAPFLPHTPHNPPERLLQRYRKAGRSIHVARYFAMCEWFDETCGQLLAELERRGLADETVVVFAVDNGWIQREDARGFAPRSKRSPNEGGVRTPIMIRWPGRVEPRRSQALASTVDLAPTILAACGLPVPVDLPGVDLLGEAASTRDCVFGEVYEHDVVDLDRPSRGLCYRFVVCGRHKLIVPARGGGRPQLYDVVADPSEQRDVAADEPGLVSRLLVQLDSWWDGRDG